MANTHNLVALDDRIASFRAHRLPGASKRSAMKAWPHAKPSVADMAKAGFIYTPSTEAQDNATCFLCHKSLDMWSKNDDPRAEHISHSPDCAWAIVCSEQWIADEEHDPDSDEMLSTRLLTYGGPTNSWWPHDGKRGWIPTSEAMSRAGFYYSPSREGDDLASCMYCGIVLDGWEPKDSPVEEHRRRQPNCFFFDRSQKPQPAIPKQKSRTSRSSIASRKRSSSVSESDLEVENMMPRRKASRVSKRISSVSELDSADETSAPAPKKRGGRNTRKSSVAQPQIIIEPEPIAPEVIKEETAEPQTRATKTKAQAKAEKSTAAKRTRGPRPMAKTKAVKAQSPLRSPRSEMPPVPDVPTVFVETVDSEVEIKSPSVVSDQASMEDIIASYAEDDEREIEEQKQREEELEQQRLEQQRLEQERLEQQRLEQQREEKLEQERLEQQRLEQQRLEQQRLEQQRLEQQRLQQQRLEQQRLEQQQQEQRLEQQRLEQQQQELQQQRERQLEEERLIEQQQQQQQLDTPPPIPRMNSSRKVTPVKVREDEPDTCEEESAKKVRGPRELLKSRNNGNAQSSPQVLGRALSVRENESSPATRKAVSDWKSRGRLLEVDTQASDAELWAAIMPGDAAVPAAEHMDKTVEQWLMYLAETGEQVLMSKCEQLIAALEREGERALGRLREC
ncbi:hypothetical protein BZA70DRAFT_206196 [Myxozyma melibiosi]|uniref:Protein bir1 n=1 Tax=Myxozyma melibiosi TaxID=54550 RepID=A0ABR1F2Z3_9ASCO